MRWGEPNECTCIRNKRMIVERGEGGGLRLYRVGLSQEVVSRGNPFKAEGLFKLCKNFFLETWKLAPLYSLSLSLYLLSLPLIISFPFWGTRAITRNDERLRKRWKARFDALSCYVTQQVLPIAVNYGGVVSLSSCCSIDRFDAVLYPLYAAFTLVYLFI